MRRLGAASGLALVAAAALPALVTTPSAAAPRPARSVAVATVAAVATTDATCADVIVYVVRGSGEAPQGQDAGSFGATWDAFDPIDGRTNGSSILAGRHLELVETTIGEEDPIRQFSPDTGTPFLYDFVEKVNQRVGAQVRLSWAPVVYPAVPVETGLLPKKLLWAIDGYPRSVTAGIRSLHRALEAQWDRCGTRTRYVLAGYSQGADVVSSYLRGKIERYTTRFGSQEVRYLGPSHRIAGQVASVALFADPNHDPSDPESLTHVDGSLANEQGLTGYRSPVPDGLVDVTDSVCFRRDIVCGQGSSIFDLDNETGEPIHTRAYIDAVDFPVRCVSGADRREEASATACLADRTVDRLGLRNLVHDPLEDASSSPGATGRDVAFVIDTTSSMEDDIDQAVAFARKEGRRISALDGRVALVQYRDAEDDVPVEVVVPLTSDFGAFQRGLQALDVDGGGDTPEGLMHALMHTFDSLDWALGAAKATVVLSDAGFHDPDLTDGSTLADVQQRSLEIDPVNVFPVVRSSAAYRALADQTSGLLVEKGGSSSSTSTALSSALDYIAGRPVAVLDQGTYVAPVGRSIRFDASGSAAVLGEVVSYGWDVDGDGVTDATTTDPTYDHTFDTAYTGLMQVVVTDSQGRSSNASASVVVNAEPDEVAPVELEAARDLRVEATPYPEHVGLHVTWDVDRDAPPLRWVVLLDGDPVRTVAGVRDDVRVPIDYDGAPHELTVEPLSRDGGTGPEASAELPVFDPPGTRWFKRPSLWLASGGGALAGLLLVGAVAGLVRLTRRAAL